MFKFNYPVRLQNDVRIVGRTEYGGYIKMYKTKEGANGIIWLPDELVSNCPVYANGSEAIDLVRIFLSKDSCYLNKYPGL